DRTLDSSQIEASVGIRGVAAEEVQELHAGGQPHDEALRDDVEVECFDAALVLSRVDPPDMGLDAERVKVLKIGPEDTLERRLVDEELDVEHLAGGID